MNLSYEAIWQVVNGVDFDRPDKLLRNITGPMAVLVPDGAPYSIATNVAHADIWQRVWLRKLEGQPSINPFPDFPVVLKEDWPSVRSSFLENLNRALAIAEATPPEDTERETRLLKFAVHGSYHMGQVKLLKRMLRKQG